MESGSFKEFMDMKNNDGPFMGDLIYPKIKEAILENYQEAFLFTLIPTENKKYPDGVKFRKLDLSKIHKLGWRSKIRLEDGLNKYYKYFKSLDSN